jgi:hypothetical protein
MMIFFTMTVFSFSFLNIEGLAKSE